MKDLALPDHLPALRAAGVSCFKIEGRKKSPLYVATTTDYYRKLHRRPAGAERTAAIRRPTCKRSSAGRGRGCSCNRTRTRKSPTATPSAIAARRSAASRRSRPAADARLRFRTAAPWNGTTACRSTCRCWASRSASRSIGCGSSTPGARASGTRYSRRRPASLVEVGLPRDHPPLPVGAPVYCSSSQAVKRRYRHERPKPGLYRPRRAVEVEAGADRGRADRDRPRRAAAAGRAGDRGAADADRAVRAGAGRGGDGSGGAGRVREARATRGWNWRRSPGAMTTAGSCRCRG